MRKTLSAIIIFALVMPCFSSAWYVGRTYEKNVTVDYSQVSGSQTNFPLLVSLSTDANLTSCANADGSDILFTNSSDALLSFEIEKYNSTNGKLVAWVRIPTLSNAANTTIFLYYGNASATTLQNASGVWDANYAAVYHLGDYNDSKGVSNGSNSGTTSTTGQIGNAKAFSGSSQYINVASTSSVAITANMTVEAWIKPTDYANYNSIVGKTNNNYPAPYDFYMMQGTGILNFYRGDGGSTNYAFSTGTNAPPAGQWSLIAASMGGTTVSFYTNGTANGGGPLSSIIGDAGTTLAIGSRADHVTMFKGSIDELRLSNSARSQGWEVTRWNNEKTGSTMVVLGAQTTAPAGGGATYIPASLSLYGGRCDLFRGYSFTLTG